MGEYLESTLLTFLLFVKLSWCLPFETGRDVMGVMEPTENDSYYSYDNDYNYELQFDIKSEFRPGSPFCDQKSKCSVSLPFSWPSKNCYCDDLCVSTGDCCPGYDPSPDFAIPEIDLFDCKVYPPIELRFGVFIVTKCPDEWLVDEIRALCEADVTDKNMLLQLPVSEIKTEILFKNMYCAHCNLRFDFNFWKTEINCENNDNGNYSFSSLTPDCDLKFLPPSRDSALKYRKCPVEDIIRSCPQNITDKDKIRNCEKGETSYVFAQRQIYKNEACAYCHNVSKDNIFCEPDADLGIFILPPDIDERKSYSFRILVDFNSGSGESGKISEEKEWSFSERCSDDEIYDPFSEQCRKIYCIPPRVAVKGKCEMNLVGIAKMSPQANASVDIKKLSENCTLVKLEPSEFIIQNNSQLLVFSSGKLYNKSEYYQLETGLFVCHYHSLDCVSECEPNDAFQSDIIESYITLILLVISLTALAFNFFIYACFHQLRNTPGKILMCLILSLFLAQLFFLVSPHLEGERVVCMISAIIIHFFYMAAFCWMNVIALDLWITFSNQFITAGSNDTSKRFVYFSLYAWIVPSIIVAVSVIIDNLKTDSNLKSFRPKYGDGACWMTSRNGVLLLFAGPLALFKIFDIIAFINTARHIYKAKKHGAAARQNNDSCTFWINLKLSLVMGLTWVFAFVANFAKENLIWYLFIVFNALQGVFIAVTFLFTRKVIRLISEKAHEFSTLTSKSATVEISTSENVKPSANSNGTKDSSVPLSSV